MTQPQLAPSTTGFPPHFGALVRSSGSVALETLTQAQLDACGGRAAGAGFGALMGPGGALPLTELGVTARITGLTAQVEIEQTFVNAFDVPIEAVYDFPLPPRAAVNRFSMEVAGRVIRGCLYERRQARRRYEEALERGHRAALAEEKAADLFTMQVGNLVPGDVARVRLSMVMPLVCRGGEATFRFPLVAAPRYLPSAGAKGGVTVGPQDAVTLPGFRAPVKLSLVVDIDEHVLPVRRVRSSLHAVAQSSVGGATRVRVVPGGGVDRDFVLRMSLADPAAVTTAFVARPDMLTQGVGDGTGTFMLTLVPPADVGQARRARDVVFVLDRSGSMEGWQMVTARRAVSRMVSSLEPQDRFAVYTFATGLTTATGGHGLVPATDQARLDAERFLQGVNACGGTEMEWPLRCAAGQLADASKGRQRVLVLITDGQIGNEDQILASLAKPLGQTRVFTVGISQAVNVGFLERLSRHGGGQCELVESEDRLEEVMERLQRLMGSPVLTELGLRGLDGLEVLEASLVPRRLPDLFAGVPVTISGRYRGGAGIPRVSVEACELMTGQPWAKTQSAVVVQSDVVGALWARGQIRALEDLLAVVGGHDEGIRREVVETSLRHKVLSGQTAFVAVDESAVVNHGQDLMQVDQPLALPAGQFGSSMAAPSPQWSGQSVNTGSLGASMMLAQRPTEVMACAPMLSSAPFAARSATAALMLDEDMRASFETMPAPAKMRRASGLGVLMLLVVLMLLALGAGALVWFLM